MIDAGGCPLCESAGGHLVVRRPKWRLIRADEPGFPAFYRLVWNDHVRELSDLWPADRIESIETVVKVESVLRRVLRPAKINIASLGNAVPHLHWHVIARFDWDSHFPGAVWAQPVREAPPQRLKEVEDQRPALERELVQALA